MKLLKKKYGKQRMRVGEVKQKAACRIALWILKLQTAFAKFMDKKINPLSAKRKKVLLYTFCLLCSSYFLWLALAPLMEKRKKDVIKIEKIQFPKPQPKYNDDLNNALISPQEYQRIHSFKLYLDSLASDKEGRAVFDSITSEHPGLMDSLKLIEEYYQLQK